MPYRLKPSQLKPNRTRNTAGRHMKQLDADALAAAVLTAAGIKVGKNDPSMQDVLIVQAMLSAILENTRTQQQAQMQESADGFQAAFAEACKPVLEAAEYLSGYKKTIATDIMAANKRQYEQNAAEIEGRIYGNIAKRTQQQFENYLKQFSDSLKKLLLTFLVAQGLILAIVMIVSR